MNTLMRWLVSGRFKTLPLKFAVALFAAIQPGHAQMPRPLSAKLEVLWSTPITVQMTADGTFGRSEGFSFREAAISSNGGTVILGTLFAAQHSGGVLLLNAETSSPDASIPLPLPMPDPPGPQFTGTWLFKKQRPNRNPGVATLALGHAGEIWLGGSSNSYTDIASGYHSDAYLAKLDRAGALVWKRTYGKGGGQLDFESVAPDATGGVVAVGGMGKSWLARVAADGTLVTEHLFGKGKGAAVVALHDGQFLVAGFAGADAQTGYQDDVSTWILDEHGGLRGPTPVREALNRLPGSYYGRVVASASPDGAYIASNWSDPFHTQAVEVARVGPDGAPLWRQSLPDTISAKETRVTTFSTCNPALVTLTNGDALVACALDGKIQLYRLNHATGEQRAVRLPLPECQRDHPAALLLMVGHNGAVLLGGSRPSNNVAGNCSWLGRLVMQAE